MLPAHLRYRMLRYYESSGDMFDMIFSFDPLHNATGFIQNLGHLKHFEAAGVKTCPVSHDLHGCDYMRLASLGYDAIAFGANANRDFPKLLSANNRLANYGVSQRHLLGVASPALLYFLPVTSADASSPFRAAARSRVTYLDYTKGPLPKIMHLNICSRGETEPCDPKYRAKKKAFMDCLDRMNVPISWSDLSGKFGWEFRAVTNMYCYQAMADIATEEQKKIAMFLAADAPQTIAH